jgi:hypothetical protein
MGSKDQNFYKNAFSRQGWAEDAEAVQQLWLEGRREEAADRVPLEIGLKTNLLGTPETIAQRLRVYRDAGVTAIRAGLHGSGSSERLQTLARLMELVDDVNRDG